MMSWLMEVQRNDPTLTPDDVLHSCILLVNAGHETTQDLICNTLTTLLQTPDQLALLRENPQHMKTAIEEGLRFNGPLKRANRTPAKFDVPEGFDATRYPNLHLSFSHGIHFCLGAPLARMEMEIAFNALLRRFPKMELTSSIQWDPRILGRSIQPPINLRLD